MTKELYKETFSHVRSSYEFNMEDFEKMKTKKRTPVKRILLIAAAVAILTTFGITASATGFFGLARVADPDSGVISLQGYVDSPEAKAYMEYLNTGVPLEEVAAKYGLTATDRNGIFSYDEMSELLGGELTDMRHSRQNAFVVYENGAFSADMDFTVNGKTIPYQLYRSVKGSLTQNNLNASYFGEGCTEWNIKVGAYDVCLVLGNGSRSLVIADLGNGFFSLNVLSGRENDTTFPENGPITEEELEALAKSFNWSLLSKVAIPDLSQGPEITYGAGVELKPEYIVEDQSFQVELPGWGEVYFITYKPTPEFESARFFLSHDGRTSDYELHAVYDENWAGTAAVNFTDLTGDGQTDIIILNDYQNDYTGKAYRTLRVYSYQGGQDFEWEEEMSDAAMAAIDNQRLTIDAVIDFFLGGQGGTLPGADVGANDYEGVLGKLMNDYKGHESYLMYGLYDFTGDGNDELLAGYGTCEADSACGVWSMDDGTLKKLGEFGIGHSRLGLDGQGRLVRLMAHMSYERLDIIGWDGESITETLVSERTLGRGDEYLDLETPLQMAADDDLLLLHGADRYGCYETVIDHPVVQGYALYDLIADGSDTLELITCDGAKWGFWTAKDGKAVWLGELDAASSSLRIKPGAGTLAAYSSNMSWASLSDIYWDGETVATRVTDRWEWSEGVESPDPGEELEFHDRADRGPLEDLRG